MKMVLQKIKKGKGKGLYRGFINNYYFCNFTLPQVVKIIWQK